MATVATMNKAIRAVLRDPVSDKECAAIEEYVRGTIFRGVPLAFIAEAQLEHAISVAALETGWALKPAPQKTVQQELNEDSAFELRRRAARINELVKIVATMLGMAEVDCLDDKSNAWRSAMIDARAALAKAQS